MDFMMGLAFSELSLMNPATVTIATVTTLMSLYMYFIQPSMIIQAYFRVLVRWSGMKMKWLKVPDSGFHFFYAEKGRPVKGQKSILLLHGFSADHFMFAPIVQHIPNAVHIVALDLPGHGFTSDPEEDDDLGFTGQVRRIKQFVDLVGLHSEPLHVVGVSMGGTLAGVFAAEYPELVAAVSLTCPSMKTPKESRIIAENRSRVQTHENLTLDNCPMLPQTATELQAMLDICHYFTVRYPQQILKGAVDLRKRRNSLYLRLLRELISPESLVFLENISHRITCPSQVIWGQQDWIVDESGAHVLKEKLPSCNRLDLLPQCGHAINLDQPRNFAKVVLEFWEQQHDHPVPKMQQ